MGTDLEDLPEEDEFKRATYEMSHPTGQILQLEDLEWIELRTLMATVPVFWEPYPADIAEDLRSDGYSEEEIEMTMNQGMTEALFMDDEPEVTKITTTDGEWLIIAQKIDGHGNLKIVKER